MPEGRVKMVFPGGNTSLGFYSFYDYIIGDDAKRVFLLKGGPGTGKSTFMKRIGKELQEKGIDLEYHWCSSDFNSLDGLVLPAHGVAIIDGTAPHVTDPLYPGAVDEIINLGDYWDQEKLVLHRDEIISLKKRVTQIFTTAYSSLKMARMAREEEKDYRDKALDYQCFHRLTGNLLRQIFGQELIWGEGVPRERHLFATALTPQGIVHHLPTLLDNLTFLYLIEGEPGSGKEAILKEVAEFAYRSGLTVEVYHCAFDPTLIDLVVLPQRKTAVLSVFKELDFVPESIPNLKYSETINCKDCLDDGVIMEYEQELREAGKLFDNCLERGLSYLKKARLFYGELEKHYLEAMDFDGIESCRKEVLERIINIVGEKK